MVQWAIPIDVRYSIFIWKAMKLIQMCCVFSSLYLPDPIRYRYVDIAVDTDRSATSGPGRRVQLTVSVFRAMYWRDKRADILGTLSVIGVSGSRQAAFTRRAANISI